MYMGILFPTKSPGVRIIGFYVHIGEIQIEVGIYSDTRFEFSCDDTIGLDIQIPFFGIYIH